MEREFRESEAFTRLIKAGEISDHQLHQLQQDIIAEKGKLIPRTGGYQKIRLEGEGRGKRGGWRVVYADYPQYGFTALVLAYPKNVKDNLTAAEEKQLRIAKAILDQDVENNYGKDKKKHKIKR